MTEKRTPPLPDPLPRPRGRKNVGGAKHVPDVSRRKSWSYKTVHWQARTHVRGYVVVVDDLSRHETVHRNPPVLHRGILNSLTTYAAR
jgi:hypothetical protein